MIKELGHIFYDKNIRYYIAKMEYLFVKNFFEKTVIDYNRNSSWNL
jgi:hypothetical protein